MTEHFIPKKVYIESGSWVWTQTQAQNQNQFDSEFNSIHFSIELNSHTRDPGPIYGKV